jgi:hypothetical protein
MADVLRIRSVITGQMEMNILFVWKRRDFPKFIYFIPEDDRPYPVNKR